MRDALTQYYLAGCFLLFVGLLVTHLLAAHIYRSAVLKALRRGRVSREQLHPRLADWLGRLDLLPAVQPPPRGLARVVRATGRFVVGRWLGWRAFEGRRVGRGRLGGIGGILVEALLELSDLLLQVLQSLLILLDEAQIATCAAGGIWPQCSAGMGGCKLMQLAYKLS